MVPLPRSLSQLRATRACLQTVRPSGWAFRWRSSKGRLSSGVLSQSFMRAPTWCCQGPGGLSGPNGDPSTQRASWHRRIAEESRAASSLIGGFGCCHRLQASSSRSAGHSGVRWNEPRFAQWQRHSETQAAGIVMQLIFALHCTVTTLSSNVVPKPRRLGGCTMGPSRSCQ